MAFRRVHKEIDGLVGAVLGLRFLHLQKELGELTAAIPGIAFQTIGIDGGYKVEAKLRLADLGELERLDAGAAGFLQEGSDRLADAGSIAKHTGAIPDILNDIDKLGIKLMMGLAYPGIMLNNLKRRLFILIADDFGDGDDRSITLGTGENQVFKLLILSGKIDAGDINAAGLLRSAGGNGCR